MKFLKKENRNFPSTYIQRNAYLSNLRYADDDSRTVYKKIRLTTTINLKSKIKRKKDSKNKIENFKFLLTFRLFLCFQY